jgi:riboflavin kinase/FMN adenylyltransferase
VESFIIDFDEQIYGKSIRLSFIKRIRDEMKFSSVPELIAQIRSDVESAQAIFREESILSNLPGIVN